MKKMKYVFLSVAFLLFILIITISSSLSLFSYNKKSENVNKILSGYYENTCNLSDGYVWNFDYTGGE